MPVEASIQPLKCKSGLLCRVHCRWQAGEGGGGRGILESGGPALCDPVKLPPLGGAQCSSSVKWVMTVLVMKVYREMGAQHKACLMVNTRISRGVTNLQGQTCGNIQSR